MRQALVAAFLLLTACAGTAQGQSPTPAPGLLPQPAFPLVERASLRFSTETLNVASSHTGVATLKRQTSRKFTFQLPKGTQELYLSTCHRELPFWKPAEAFVYNYVPALALTANEPLEYAGNCMLVATAITQRGKVLRALVSFSGDETAKARVYCDSENGVEATGHFLCQARGPSSAGSTGSVQALVFDKQMHATWKDSCAPLRTKDNKGFVLELAAGLCTYAFQSFDKSEWFRLTTYGYTQISLPDYE